MGSRARNSTRASARSAKRPARPRDEEAAERPEQAALLTELQETRSILAVAAQALDETADPHRLDARDTCATEDVAVVVRLGIQRLDATREALDIGGLPGGGP